MLVLRMNPYQIFREERLVGKVLSFLQKVDARHVHFLFIFEVMFLRIGYFRVIQLDSRHNYLPTCAFEARVAELPEYFATGMAVDVTSGKHFYSLTPQPSGRLDKRTVTLPAYIINESCVFSSVVPQKVGQTLFAMDHLFFAKQDYTTARAHELLLASKDVVRSILLILKHIIRRAYNFLG